MAEHRDQYPSARPTRSGAGDVERPPHLCRLFTDPADYRRQAVDFLADGLAIGLRAVYVGSGPVDELTADLEDLDGREELMAGDALRVSSLDSLYGSGAIVRPDEPLAGYAAATDEALAAGFTGLRVAADATALVERPDQRAAFSRYEYLIDRYMAGHPFSAMCGYRQDVLGEAAAELACLHPAGGADTAPFRLFTVDEGAAGLAGEIDIAGWDLFRLALDRTRPAEPDGQLVIDLSGLDFMDHRGLMLLDDYARAAGASVVLRSAPLMVSRIVDILQFEQVQVKS